MTKKKWTLNADVGEGCDDALVMPYIDCANVACAAHAGSEEVIRQTLSLAQHNNVTVGAHPGYPDKENFGRFSLDMSSQELTETLEQQIRLLITLAKESGVSVAYVKPHGALNHDMLQKNEVFETICRVVSGIDTGLALMIPTNAKQNDQQAIAESFGLNVWWEVFADRAYEPSGLLRPRKYDDAVHSNYETVAKQLEHIRQYGEIIAIDGSALDVGYAQTICIHGDNEPSVVALKSLSA
ncbi:MAG: LamB/YcsF family protein [Gammaproteobacteria bacterium]|nr:LamB/YcsF family protein [Gammaproteobacteria bacterium]